MTTTAAPKVESAAALARRMFHIARKHGPAFDAEDYIAKDLREHQLALVRAVLDLVQDDEYEATGKWAHHDANAVLAAVVEADE